MAASIVRIPASLSSLTSRSCSVPNARSERPLDRGEDARRGPHRGSSADRGRRTPPSAPGRSRPFHPPRPGTPNRSSRRVVQRHDQIKRRRALKPASARWPSGFRCRAHALAPNGWRMAKALHRPNAPPAAGRDRDPVADQGRSGLRRRRPLAPGKMLVAGDVEVENDVPGRLRLAVMASSPPASPRARRSKPTAGRPTPAPPTSDTSPVVGAMAAHVDLPWLHRAFSNAKTWA